MTTNELEAAFAAHLHQACERLAQMMGGSCGIDFAANSYGHKDSDCRYRAYFVDFGHTDYCDTAKEAVEAMATMKSKAAERLRRTIAEAQAKLEKLEPSPPETPAGSAASPAAEPVASAT